MEVEEIRETKVLIMLDGLEEKLEPFDEKSVLKQNQEYLERTVSKIGCGLPKIQIIHKRIPDRNKRGMKVSALI